MPTFGEDVALAFFAPLGFAIIAALPLGIMGIAQLYDVIFRHAPASELGDWLSVVTAVYASYALAATVGGPIYGLSRPIRDRYWGAMIVGPLISFVCYGSVYVIAVLMWEPAGRLLFGDHGTTRAEFIAEGRIILPIFAFIGLVAGPFILWRSRRGERARRGREELHF